MFSILLLNEREQVLEIQYAVRFGHPVRRPIRFRSTGDWWGPLYGSAGYPRR